MPGATAASYTPTAADHGHELAVRVTTTAPGYGPASVTVPAGTVATGVLAATSALRISGKTRVGQRVAARLPGWSGPGVSLEHEWRVGGKVVATTPRYRLKPRDRGKQVQLRVTASAPGYAPVTVTSGQRKVRKGRIEVERAPRVKGKAAVGTRLRATKATWRTAKVKVRYQWLRGKRVVSTGRSYRVTAADAGKRLRVRVVAQRKGFQTLRVKSPAVRVAR